MVIPKPQLEGLCKTLDEEHDASVMWETVDDYPIVFVYPNDYPNTDIPTYITSVTKTAAEHGYTITQSNKHSDTPSYIAFTVTS